jgi:hypothetical protein
VDDHGTEDEAHEWKRRAGAIPIAIALAFGFHSCDTGHFLQRTALTMPLHELGHATTAWWSGYAALPTLWKTLIPDERGALVPLVLGLGTAFVAWRGWTTERLWLTALAVGLGVCQFIATGMTASNTAHMLITFGGDAGAMVLGTIAMLTFFSGPDSPLRNGGLRYGLLGIGAAALVDTFAMWWTARRDRDVIPFGEIEGVGLSDPSKLDEYYNWTVKQIVDRHVTVGTCCVAVVITAWAWSTWRARQRSLESATEP